jgi:hypothetical protein
MNADTQGALIGLWGVIIGAVVSLFASVVVPWIRDTIDRKRAARETAERERRDWLMTAITALLEIRQSRGGAGHNPSGTAMTRFGEAYNQLTIRLTKREEDVLSVLQVMLAMIQEPRHGIHTMIAEAMVVLTLWERGDVPTERIVSEVERRAGVKFSDDRKSVAVVAPPQL